MKTTLSLCFITLITCFSLSATLPAQAQFTDTPTQTERNQPAARSNPFEQFVSIINFVFAVAFLAALLGIVIATVRFIIAGGNEKMIGGANSLWTSSLVALGIAVGAYVIINTIRYYLR